MNEKEARIECNERERTSSSGSAIRREGTGFKGNNWTLSCMLMNFIVASSSDGLAEVLSFIRIRDQPHVSRTHRVANLNLLAKKVRETAPSHEGEVEQIVYSVRWSLCSGVQEVRAGGLRVLRYLLTTEQACDIFCSYHMPILVVRCLDRSNQQETERLQALRLMRQMLIVAPKKFPRSFAASLVSLATQFKKTHDPLVWVCIGTLCELAIVNSLLAAQCGVIKALLRTLLTCQVARMNEAIVQCLLCLVNHPDTRRFVHPHFDIESVMSPITDLNYEHEAVELDGRNNLQDRDTHIEASKVALTAMLKCWAGLIYLSQSGMIRTILEMLPLADPVVQKGLLEVFFDVFHIRLPEWTECFIQVLKSVETSRSSVDWMLSEGWVAEEGKYLLPPRTTSRTNLVVCYLSMLLFTLINCGLSKVFTQLYERSYQSLEQQRVSVRATVLIGELIHFSSSYIPVELSHTAHCVPDLIASATQFTNHARRSLASQVINCLDRIHQIKKHSTKPSSLFLDLIFKQAGYYKRTGRNEISQYVSKDLEDIMLINIIKDTQVTQTKDYTKWNLKLVISLLQSPALQFSKLDETYGLKFIKRLTNFFKPSNYIFTMIQYSVQNTMTYSVIGCSLVNFLIKTSEGTQRYLMELISDIVSQLGQVTAHKQTADVFTASSITNTLSKDYFLFLGYVSYQKPAVLLACKAYAPLLAICDVPHRNDLLKLIVSLLDYSQDVYGRVVLTKILTSSDQQMRLYATKHLRVLLRTKMKFFNNWGIQMLVTQLYDVDEEVAMEAVDILDEACEEESCLIALIIQRPALLHLAEKGVSLLTRFISTSRGFNLMQELGYLHEELDRWFTSYNKLYVQLVERHLAEAFTSYKPGQEGSFVRRSAPKSCRNAQVFVPIHFYGQLVQQPSGCDLLQQQGHVKLFSDIVRHHVTSSSDILNIKATIWALGHIGSSPLGLDMLLGNDIIKEIVLMAANNPVFSVRGTCFYALCLIAKTKRGVEQLKQLGWVSVCHSHEHKWPVVNKRSSSSSSSKDDAVVRNKLPFHHQSSLPAVILTSTEDSTAAARRKALLKKYTSTMKVTGIVVHNQKITEDKVSEYNDQEQHFHVGSIPDQPPKMRNGNPSPQQRPLSMLSFSSSDLPSSPAASSNSNNHKKSVTGSYLGLCIPLDYDRMYKFKVEPFKGSWPASFPVKLEQPGVIGLVHNPSHCLQCSYNRSSRQPSSSDLKDQVVLVPTQQENKMRPRTRTNDSAISSDSSHTPNTFPADHVIFSHTPNRIDSGLDEETDKRQRSSLAGSLGDVAVGSLGGVAGNDVYGSVDMTTSSEASRTTIESHVSHKLQSAHEEQQAVRKEVLSLVSKLSSEVAARANSQGLNLLFEQFPETSQDVCLYSQVCDLLTVYQYSMPRRKLIQSKFQDMTFDSIFPDSSCTDEWPVSHDPGSHDCASKLMYSDSFSARSNVAMVTRQRRRSSTGDVELVQKDINKVVQLSVDSLPPVTQGQLLPVKMEAIGTPSSINSIEESLLHPITTITQQTVATDDVINLDTHVANSNEKSSEC